jgi:hypothetical protein
MPDWVTDKQRRAERIRQAKAELEAEAKASAEAKLKAAAEACAAGSEVAGNEARQKRLASTTIPSMPC